LGKLIKALRLQFLQWQRADPQPLQTPGLFNFPPEVPKRKQKD